MKMRILLLAAALPLAACSDAGLTDPAPRPAGPSRVAVAAPPACVKFGPMPAAWTVWGAPAGHVPGSLVHTEATIDVRVQRFVTPAAVLFNQARLEPAAAIGWGSFNSLHLIDISTVYHFMAAGGWVPNFVRFRYQDLGGIENLAINGTLYVGDIALAPAVLGGASVVVTPGVVDITGPVTDLLIGGHNFRVDDLCAAP